ncbi:hypothetical protein Pcac1_g11464 [Phytophthora cactorum]|nr:hypothetical protein Pcac1_g11464 [Phytophthora cactorum]
MPKKGARSSKPSTSATKGNVVKGMTKKKERPSKTKPRANSPRDDAPAADAATRSSPGPTANQPASAPGEIASDASSGPLGKSTRASATDKETPAGGAICASPGPTLSSSPARAAKEKAPASRSSTGLPKTKQHASTHAEKALGFEASIRRFVQAARVEAEKEAASSHTAAQDDTETVSGQVNVEAIDGDAEPIVETNAMEGKTSSLDADSNTQHNDAVNNENNNEITSHAVVEAEKMKRKGSSYFGNDSESDHPDCTTKEIIVFFPGGTPKFTSGAVYRMKAFYEIRRKCDAWLTDMDWVLSTKWENMLSTPELFDEDTDGLLPSESGEKHKEMAKGVARILDEACLGSMFPLSGSEATVKVGHLVGMLTRERMLSDIIIDFIIRCICNSVGDCFAIDSYAPTFGCPTPPVTSISMFHYAVLLIHLSNIHWGIIMVRTNNRQAPHLHSLLLRALVQWLISNVHRRYL